MEIEKKTAMELKSDIVLNICFTEVYLWKVKHDILFQSEAFGNVRGKC